MTPIRTTIAVISSVPLLLTAVRLAGWWPCDVACQGGGWYQRFAGLDVLWGGLLGYALLTAVVWNDALRRLHWTTLTAVTAGLLAGISLFYLGVAWQLGITCPFCLTVHTVVLVVLLAVAGDAAGPTAISLLLGLLGTNAAFHHTAVPDVLAAVPHTQGTTAPSVTSQRAAQADANRRRGPPDAPITIEYGFSLQCGHCAEQHQPLLDALAPALAAGRVHLVMRPIIRPADAGGRWLAAWALAAAAESPDDFNTFLTKHLATRSGLTRDELLALGDDLPERNAAAQDGHFNDLITADQLALRKLGYQGATPLVVIIHNGIISGRFLRDLPLPAIVELLDKQAP